MKGLLEVKLTCINKINAWLFNRFVLVFLQERGFGNILFIY